MGGNGTRIAFVGDHVSGLPWNNGSGTWHQERLTSADHGLASRITNDNIYNDDQHLWYNPNLL